MRIFYWSPEANDIFSGEHRCGHGHMCFIYSSSFTAVTQSSMARAVCRQMWLISPQLSFKGRLTACPGALVGMLWAQLKHSDRNMLPQQCSCKRGKQITALLPAQREDHDMGMLPAGARLPLPARALTRGSNLPLSAPFITSWKRLNQGKASLWQLHPTPAASHSTHGVVVGWIHQPCPQFIKTHSNHDNSFCWLSLSAPLWCPLLCKETTQFISGVIQVTSCRGVGVEYRCWKWGSGRKFSLIPLGVTPFPLFPPSISLLLP